MANAIKHCSEYMIPWEKCNKKLARNLHKGMKKNHYRNSKVL